MEERRAYPERITVCIPGWIRGPGLVRTCRLENVSPGGAKLMLENASGLPDRFLLLLSPTGNSVKKCLVRWRAIGAIGVEFEGIALLASATNLGTRAFI